MNTWNSANIYLPFFHDLLTCGQNLYSWIFDQDLTLLEDNSPETDRYRFLFLMEEMGPGLLKLGLTEAKPVIVTNSLDVLWVADFEYNDHGALWRVHVIGPVLIDSLSESKLDASLAQLSLFGKTRQQVRDTVRSLPVVPFTRLLQYSLMLHFTITGEKITTQDLRFLGGSSDSTRIDAAPDSSHQSRKGSWEQEQEILRHVMEGSERDRRRRDQVALGAIVGRLASGDTLRQLKDTVIIFTALCMRAALQGGVLPDTAYELSDRYIQAIEACSQVSEVAEISRLMEDDFTARVRKVNETSAISREVRECMDYIALHPDRKPTVAELATMVGHAPNYLTSKFKAETGKTIGEYILSQQMEYAKTLLKSTNRPVQEIAEQLGFATQSHFGKRFREYTGCSPSEYRGKAGFDFDI
ncbi:MAG: helix-turn-helix domain-containing protein [Firmicutes bacterium]|nr:helix-turn-helix domain-containing protein [Bacillota bacterium]